MKILRIENSTTRAGMWYSESGDYDPVIKTIPNAKARDLPMGFDIDKYRKDNKIWVCGCYSFELLEQWFSKNDRIELYARGYALFEFETDDFIIEEHQVLYTPVSVAKKLLIENL